MPPDLPNEQEITLKKRARRRLVGAIALVLLMVIVLPAILQDRAELVTTQEAIKVTMPEVVNQAASVSPSSVTNPAENPPLNNGVDHIQPALEAPSSTEIPVSTIDSVGANAGLPTNAPVEVTQPVTIADNTKEPAVDATKSADSNLPGLAANEVKIAENKVVEPKVSKPKASETKQVTSKANEPKSSQAKAVETKSKVAVNFSVQVGVFSDEAKVKHLQSKLKEIGYSSHTEKLTTPKGEKIRLRAGSFSTRQNAIAAQANIKKIGLDGIVVGND